MSKLAKLSLVSVFALAVALTAGHVQAEHGYGKQGNKGCSYCSLGKGRSNDDLQSKFFHKAFFLMDNQDALGLSDKQVDDIKALKLDVKKKLIRLDADIEIAKMDIQAGLYGRNVDTGVLHQLVDQKYEHKKAKSMLLVDSYVQLKGTLTDSQYDKMKQLWKANKA